MYSRRSLALASPILSFCLVLVFFFSLVAPRVVPLRWWVVVVGGPAWGSLPHSFTTFRIAGGKKKKNPEGGGGSSPVLAGLFFASTA